MMIKGAYPLTIPRVVRDNTQFYGAAHGSETPRLCVKNVCVLQRHGFGVQAAFCCVNFQVLNRQGVSSERPLFGE